MSQIYNNMEEFKYLEWLRRYNIDILDDLSNFYINESNSVLYYNKKVFRENRNKKLPLIIQAKLEIYEQEY